MIAKFTDRFQSDWDQFLGLLTFAYNSSPHSAQGTAPLSLVRRDPVLSIMDYIHLQPINTSLRSEWGERGRVALNMAYDTATTYQRNRRTQSEQRTNEHFQAFQLNDIVWVRDRAAPRDGRKKKHSLGHSGPFRVVECNNDLSYTVANVADTSKRYRVHFLHMALASPHQQEKYALTQRPSSSGTRYPYRERHPPSRLNTMQARSGEEKVGCQVRQ